MPAYLRREGKHYIYDVDRDIVEWEKTPEKKELKDGQVLTWGDALSPYTIVRDIRRGSVWQSMI